MIRLLRRLLPVTTRFHGEQFFVRESVRAGDPVRLVATPLFVVLCLVETTDLVFALDSIPAIFGVTRDPFLVYTSNVFAILGLRSLYFVLAGVIGRFHLLQYGLSLVLAFVGAKMLRPSTSDRSRSAIARRGRRAVGSDPARQSCRSSLVIPAPVERAPTTGRVSAAAGAGSAPRRRQRQEVRAASLARAG